MAKSTRFGRLPVYVGLWDVSEKVLAQMRCDCPDWRARGCTQEFIAPARRLCRIMR